MTKDHNSESYIPLSVEPPRFRCKIYIILSPTWRIPAHAKANEVVHFRPGKIAQLILNLHITSVYVSIFKSCQPKGKQVEYIGKSTVHYNCNVL